jgi:hypothetical protein
MGGVPRAAFWVDFQAGYMAVDNASAPLISPSGEKGEHGYFPDNPAMWTTFIVAGPGIGAGRNLGDIDMRDIAPTLAKVLGVPLPSADGKPLF